MFELAFRRGLRLRSKTQDEAADTPTAEESKEEGEDEEEQMKTENKEEDGKKKEEDEEPMDAEDCEVCPGKDFVSPVLTPEFNVFLQTFLIF